MQGFNPNGRPGPPSAQPPPPPPPPPAAQPPQPSPSQPPQPQPAQPTQPHHQQPPNARFAHMPHTAQAPPHIFGPPFNAAAPASYHNALARPADPSYPPGMLPARPGFRPGMPGPPVGNSPTMPTGSFPGRPRDWDDGHGDKKRPRPAVSYPTSFPYDPGMSFPKQFAPPVAGPFARTPLPNTSAPSYAFQKPPPRQPALSDDTLPAPPRKDRLPVDPRARQEHLAPPVTPSGDEPETLKQFLTRQPDSISPDDVKAAYDEYLRDFVRRKPSAFFSLHKTEEWFKERYDPDYVMSRTRRIQQECQDRAKEYRIIWDHAGSSVCAPDISFHALRTSPSAHDRRGEDRPMSDVSPARPNEKQPDSTGTPSVSAEISTDVKAEAQVIEAEGIKAKAVKAEETVKTETVKTETAKTETAKTETAKTEESVNDGNVKQEGDIKTNEEPAVSKNIPQTNSGNTPTVSQEDAKKTENDTEKADEILDEPVDCEGKDEEAKVKVEEDKDMADEDKVKTAEEKGKVNPDSGEVKTDVEMVKVDEDKVNKEEDNKVKDNVKDNVKVNSDEVKPGEDKVKADEEMTKADDEKVNDSDDKVKIDEDKVMPPAPKLEKADTAPVKSEEANAAAQDEKSSGTVQDGKAEQKLASEVKVAEAEQATVATSSKESAKASDEEKTPVAKGGKPCVRLPKMVLPLRREHQKDTIFMRGIPINLPRDSLTAVLQRGPADNEDLRLRRLKIGDINPHRSLQRFAWAVYADEEAASHALDVVKGAFVKGSSPTLADKISGDRASGDSLAEREDSSTYVIDCMLNLERKKKYGHGRVLPAPFGAPERMTKDVVQAVKIMRFLDTLRKFEEGLNPLTDELLESMPSDAKRLDHIVTYLREVHYYCYYSGNEFLEDATSMPPQELRPAGDRFKSLSEADHRMLKRVDERTKWVLERDYDRPRSNSDHAELAKENAVKRWLEANTVHEGENRFRCALPPNKLFKAPAFVHKHLKLRHADKMKEVAEKAYNDVYRANFENDPSKAEVISIYNEGMGGMHSDKTGQGRARASTTGVRDPSYGNMNQMGPSRSPVPMGMYNTAFMGMGMQPMPMMMMPPSGYSYPNAAMAYAGRGMGTGNMGGRMGVGDMGRGGMGPAGPKDDMNASAWRRPGPRSGDGRDHRDGGSGFNGGPHEHGPPRGGHRGGRRGGFSRRGGRGGDGSETLDPRAMGPRRNYTDLDAPAKGPSFDIVRYEDV